MVHYIFILYNVVMSFISLSKRVAIIPSIKKNENITQYKSIEFYQPVIYINDQHNLFIL